MSFDRRELPIGLDPDDSILVGKHAKAIREIFKDRRDARLFAKLYAVRHDERVLRVIRRIYKKYGLTADTIKESAHVYIERGKEDYRWASAGVSALRFAGQFLGMIRGDGEGTGDRLSLTLNVLALDGESIARRARLLAEQMADAIETASSATLPQKTAHGLPQDGRSRCDSYSDTSYSDPVADGSEVPMPPCADALHAGEGEGRALAGRDDKRKGAA